MTRFASITDESFDVAIIGGGIIGCGVARDAAMRGLRVVLFEKNDFGSGTTSGSTRIVHGGLRYLQTADVRLVRMDLRERETLLRIAPHLVKPLEFVIPFDAVGALQRLKLRVGLSLYDALAFDSSLPRHRSRSNEAAYYDARLDAPERLCIENLMDATRRHAAVFNYVEVTGARHENGRVTGVRVRDRLTGADADVTARVTVNASGPWFERVARAVGGGLPSRIRTTKGVHLVCPPLTEKAQVLFSRIDGRLMFAIPRHGQTWLGTTDTDYTGDPADAVATLEDVDYVVDSLQGAFPGLSAADVLYTTAGVRALVTQPGNASSVSRLHKIADDEGVGSPGLVSILGAKITGYRAIAEDATDVVCRRLGVSHRSVTATTPLPGGATPRSADSRWPHLYDLYGSRTAEVITIADAEPDLACVLSPKYPDIGAQVALAARKEFCVTVSDFIRRRSLLGATADQGRSAAPAVARLLAQELGWSPERQQREVDAYEHDIEKTVSFRSAGHERPRRVSGRAQ
jgi:glycerol-3-phosphate dehydrogenase